MIHLFTQCGATKNNKSNVSFNLKRQNLYLFYTKERTIACFRLPYEEVLLVNPIAQWYLEFDQKLKFSSENVIIVDFSKLQVNKSVIII